MALPLAMQALMRNPKRSAALHFTPDSHISALVKPPLYGIRRNFRFVYPVHPAPDCSGLSRF